MNHLPWTINFDGGCIGGNPGGAAVGSWIIRGPDQKIVEQGAKLICKGEGATSNVAEWGGLVHGLERLHSYTQGMILIRGDSQLVVNQVKGVYQVKQEHLKPWKAKAVEILDKFDIWQAIHVKRELNKEADEYGKTWYEQTKGIE